MTAGALTSEKLTTLFLARIDAYEKSGPKLRAIITLNPRALDEARTLDAERKAKGLPDPIPADYCVTNTSDRVVSLILGTARLSNSWDGIRQND